MYSIVNLFTSNNFFYYILFYTRVETMIQQSKREILIRSHNKDKHFIRINQSGIYEIKDYHKHNHKKLFALSPNLRVRIVKTQLLENKYIFTVKFSQDNNVVLGIVESKQQIQKFLKVIGFFITIHGFQQTVSVFKKTGEGAFAQVYEVVTNYQQRFAVKCFQKKQLQKCDKSNKAFFNQIELMKKLNCPYIIPYQYVFQTEKAYYLKMEFLSKTLKQKISSKILVREQKLIMKQLITALHEMKMKNFIHRDLKPQNIMFRTNEKGEEECVIIDFGLGTFADAHPYIYFRCGTPGFLAPEIANLGDKNQKQICAADMFSLGCIFYKILTGHYLFSGKTAKEVLQANRKCQFTSHAFEKLSVDQRRLLLKMIESEPGSRIKPQQALKDPYFNQQIDDSDQIPDEQCKIEEKVKKISQINTTVKSMDSIRSSMMSIVSFTSQAYKEGNRTQLRDSCITFEFRSKMDSQKEMSLRRSALSKSANGRRVGSSQRKSRFSQLQYKPQL